MEKHTPREDLLRRITYAIKKSETSMSKFAKKAGISAGYLSDILKGKKIPSDRVINEICKNHSLSEQWIKTGKGNIKEIAIETIERDQSIDQVISIMNELNEERKNEIVKYAEERKLLQEIRN